MPETRQQCRHILPAGRRCLAPCLRTRDFCFFHQTSRPARRTRIFPQPTGFAIARPEDRASIQTALGDILERLAAAELDPRRARLMLYALQIACHNLPRPLHPSLEPATDQTGNPSPDFVDDIDDHPTLGPIALPAPYTPPPTEPAALTEQRLFEDLLLAGYHAPVTPELPSCPRNPPHPPGLLQTSPSPYSPPSYP